MKGKFLEGADAVVLTASLAIVGGLVAWGVLAPDNLNTVMGGALTWMIAQFGWVFILIALGALGFCVFLVIHPWGKIKLGPDDATPDFSTPSWVSMMFAAGLGAGILFYGISEPISHFSAPPHGLAEPETREAGLIALRWTYLHWGFNGWAIYAILGGALAYFSYRHNAPTLVSSLFRPLLGPDVSSKPIGRAIDVFSITATLLGMAISLGLAGLSLNSGINYLLPSVPKSNLIAMLLIAMVTLLFVISATTGVEKGVQFLANAGAMATVVLMFFFLFAGGFAALVMSNAIESIGDYVIQVFPMSLLTGAGGNEAWMAAWTIFYWAWWISWGPFVGMFVARISRGRTLREFIVGVVAAPTGMAFVWFAFVGGTGIEMQLSGKADLVGTVDTPELSMFMTLDALPLATFTSIVCVLLIALFFVSGADAASVVMGMMASGGRLRPAKVVTITFGVMMGAIAGVLLLAGGLTALQQAAILGSVPFVFILIGIVWSWVKAMRSEFPSERRRTRAGASSPDVVAQPMP
jgi:choline/carnitine/betaine transport